MSSMIAQEVRKVQFSTQGLFAGKGESYYTYFGLEISRESKRKNFYNSLLFDVNYIDYSFQIRAHEFMMKISFSKSYLFERKHYYHELGLGISGFKFNFASYSIYNDSRAYGIGVLPYFSIGAKWNNLKVGVGSNCLFGIGQRKSYDVFNNYIDKRFIRDIYLNAFVKLTITL